MRHYFFFLAVVTYLTPSAEAQPYSTNSNFRIEMGPGQFNPMQNASGSAWYIEDYIDALTVANDIIFIDPLGNRFFNYRTSTAGSINPYYYGKFFFDGLSDVGIDSGIVMSSGRVVYCGAPLSVDPGIWPGIPHAAIYHSSGP